MKINLEVADLDRYVYMYVCVHTWNDIHRAQAA